MNKNKFKALQREALPHKAHFNVVNICNANCVFCAYQHREDENSTMSNEIFSLAAKQYAGFAPDSIVSLTPTVGDPLIDKDVFKKVAIAKRYGIKRVQFYTNAILLKRRMAEVLAAPLDNLEISLADFDKTEYEAIFRVNRYGAVLEGMHLLLKALKEGKSALPVNINLRHRRPLDVIFQSPDYKTYIEPYLTEHISFSNTDTFDNWMGMIKQKDLLPGMKLRKDTKEATLLPCRRLFDMQFLPSGDVRICGCRFKTSVMDDLVVGNITENSLKEIWFSDKVLAMRSKFFEGVFPSACQSCSFYTAVGAEPELSQLYPREQTHSSGSGD